MSASNPASGVFLFDNAGANKGTLYWDANGGSGADAIALAKLQGVSSLTPSDFHVVADSAVIAFAQQIASFNTPAAGSLNAAPLQPATGDLAQALTLPHAA